MATVSKSLRSLILIGTTFVFALPAYSAEPLQKGPHAWTYDDAKNAWLQAPDDPFTQFLIMQTARMEGRFEESQEAMDRASLRRRRGGAGEADLFSLTSGSLAVQESLQLDTLLGGNDQTPTQWKGDVPIDSLTGPTVKSHPWKEMLGGREPRTSRLSRYVPHDNYLVEARSLSSMLEILDSGDLWQKHVTIQAGFAATSHPIAQRVRRKLALEVSDVFRPLFDTVVDGVAITGSDLYIHEGNDVTLIFSLKQPELFRPETKAILDAAAATKDARQSQETWHGIEIRHVQTADGTVDVYAADPLDDVHLRSTSATALKRVLDIIDEAEGAAPTLGQTDEFRYIRTLMPLGAPEEHVLVYLSDPFIRRILGPRVKLTERRCMIGLSHLRVLTYAAVLFQTQYGRTASSIEELVSTKCAPEGFGNGTIVSPFGGTYSLDADGLTARCSVIGTVADPTPVGELPLDKVTREEADAYRQFVEEYERYWRQFFDPIAIRIQATPKRYRAETIVLPLIDNSIYQSLLMAVGGEPVPLETLPVPKSNIGGVSFHLNKMALMQQANFLVNIATASSSHNQERYPDVVTLLEKGLGEFVTLNVCDSDPLFDLNLTQLGGLLGRGRFDEGTVAITMLVASLTSPVYIGIPVKDREVVDRFLSELDQYAAVFLRETDSRDFFDMKVDYYLLDRQNDQPETRVLALRLGPATWRFYFTRIDDGLYFASRRSILDDIAAAPAPPAGDSDKGSKSHVILRYRPEHWDRILPSYELGWAENARLAVLKNIGSLNPFLRASMAMHPDATDDAEIIRKTIELAESVHGVQFLLPDGGAYVRSGDGRQIVHSRYGGQLLPRQSAAPEKNGPLQKAVSEFGGLTAELTFLQDGLHGVVTIERRKP